MTFRRNGLAFALALALAALAAPARVHADDKVDGDLKKLQGTWKPMGGEGGNASYAFSGKTLKIKGDTRSYTMTVVLDEKAKPEKAIDFKIDDGPDDAKGKTSVGIYKFDGDKFVFCFRAEGARPEKFEQVGFEQFLITLAKEKD